MALPVVEYLYGFPVLDPEDAFFAALEDGVFQPATTTKLTLLTDYGMKIVFKGDFTIDGMGVVTGGTVSSFVAVAGNTKVLKGDGFSMSATALIDAVGEWQVFNDQPLEDLFLDIPTKFVGSDQIDFLFGGPAFGTKLLGKGGDDELVAGAADQTLKGGDGDDFLFAIDGLCFFYGGNGNDVFAFLDPTEPNKIKDLNPEDDLIALDGFGFDAIGPGFLDDSQFRIGKQAKTAEQIVIYDSKSGAIYFDNDGSGSEAQVQFAKVTKGLDLAAGNFYGELFGAM
jgi:Ca2+-binding RTX toxin-like protein